MYVGIQVDYAEMLTLLSLLSFDSFIFLSVIRLDHGFSVYTGLQTICSSTLVLKVTISKKGLHNNVSF